MLPIENINPDIESSTSKYLNQRQVAVLNDAEGFYPWKLFEKNGQAILLIGEEHLTSERGQELADRISAEFRYVAYEGMDLEQYFFPSFTKAAYDQDRENLKARDPEKYAKPALISSCAPSDEKICLVFEDLASIIESEFAKGSKYIVINDLPSLNLLSDTEKRELALQLQDLSTQINNSSKDIRDIDKDSGLVRFCAERDHQPDFFEKLIWFNSDFRHVSIKIMTSDLTGVIVAGSLIASVGVLITNCFLKSDLLSQLNFYAATPFMLWTAIFAAKVIQNNCKFVKNICEKFNDLLRDYHISKRNESMLKVCFDFLEESKLKEPLALATGIGHFPNFNQRLKQLGWKLLGKSKLADVESKAR